ncbi:MAG: peptidyl-prolyl cis-trans isomerase [Colwellia sp.]
MKKTILLSLFILGVLLSVAGSGIKSSFGFSQRLTTVNGHVISLAEFNDIKANNPELTASESLALMIDNLLLLQRAQELGLLQSDRVIRKVIVRSVIEQEIKQVLTRPIDEKTLVDFYQRNLMMFTPADQYQVEIAHFSADDNRCRQSELFKQRWKKSDVFMFYRTSEQTDNPLIQQWQQHLVEQPLGQSLHSEALLYRQLGNQLTQKIVQLHQGELSATIPSDKGCSLILLTNKVRGQAISFDVAKPQVLAEYRVVARRKALTDLLLILRENADITIAQDIAKEINGV